MRPSQSDLKSPRNVQKNKSDSSILNNRELEDLANLADINKIADMWSKTNKEMYSQANNLHQRLTDSTSYYYRNALRQLGHKDDVKEVLKQLISLENTYIKALKDPNGAPQADYRVKYNPIEIIHHYLSGRLTADNLRLTALPAEFQSFIALVKTIAWDGECQEAYRSLIQNNEYYYTENINKTLAKDCYLFAILYPTPATEALNSGDVPLFIKEENNISDSQKYKGISDEMAKARDRSKEPLAIERFSQLKDSSSPNIAESRALNQPSTFRIKKPENEPRYSKKKVGHNFIFTHNVNRKQYILLRETDANGKPLEKVRWLEQPFDQSVARPSDLEGSYKGAAGIVDIGKNDVSKVVFYSNTATFKDLDQDDGAERFNEDLYNTLEFMNELSDKKGQNILAGQRGLAINQVFYYTLENEVHKLIIAPKQAFGNLFKLRLKNKMEQETSPSRIFKKLQKQNSTVALDRFKDMLLGGFKQLAQQIDFMHSKYVYHHDLKPENIMVQQYVINQGGEDLRLDELKLSIVDWGMARRIDAGHKKIPKSLGGTPGYVHKNHYNEVIDINQRLDKLQAKQRQKEINSPLSEAAERNLSLEIGQSAQQAAILSQKKDQFAYLHTFFALINLGIKPVGADGWGKLDENDYHTGKLIVRTQKKLREGLMPYIKDEALDVVIKFIMDPKKYSLANGLADIFRASLA